MDFEYDLGKSATNKAKHKIDLEEAQALWDDDQRVQASAVFEGEERYLVVARMAGQYWAAFWTPRMGRIRLISVRRARKKEIEYYDQNNGN